MKTKLLLHSVMVSGLLLSACRSPEISSVLPEVTEPEAWLTPVSTEEKLAAKELAVWWTQFDDEMLTQLVQRCLDENLNLKNAAARVEEALGLRGISAGEQVPQVNAAGGIFETQLSELEAGVPDYNYTGYSVGFDASWELDLWGRIRKSVDAADANVQASIEDLRGVRALIAAEAVSGYITLRELQLRQVLAIENIVRQQETLDLTRGRFDAGLVPKLDVNQAMQNLASTEASLPILRQMEMETLRALEILAGYVPGQLQAELSKADDVPVVAQAKLASIPANVLRRRPDIRALEQRLYAAALRVGVAQADLYPRISLSGAFAWQADDAGNLFDSNSISSSWGPSIFIPIFQGGRLRSQVDVAESRALQAELTYKQQVLEALGEVEDALFAYQQENERLAKLREGVVAGEATVVQVRSLYENGLVTFLNVLDAERNLAALQDSAAASLGQSSRNLVSVYRVLGGGWDAPEFDAPVKAVVQERVDVSENEAILTVMDIVDGVITFNVSSYLQYTRIEEGSAPLSSQLVVDVAKVQDAESAKVMGAVMPGERIRLAWTEVKVTEEDDSFVEAVVYDAELLSSPSP
ncbi:efflux transporter outer membrane subunit [Kiritimatiellota bacterium B12222]|nr:efflux transporter outer membrane subunit [Kiritimatiellota bacterium B12222]